MQNALTKKYGDWDLITGRSSGIGAELADQIAAKAAVPGHDRKG